MPGPDDWYDGNGDPAQSPKYRRAIEALEQPGKSPELVADLQEATKYYRMMHKLPEPSDAELAGGASAPQQRGMGDLRAIEARDAREQAFNAAEQRRRFGGQSLPGQMTASGVAALGRGAGQGASMRFGDEAAGVGAAIAGAVNGQTPRAAGRGIASPLAGEQAALPPLRQHPMARRPSAPSQPSSDYLVGREMERRANAAAQRQHPVLYGAGELAGAAAPAVALGAAGGAAGSAVGAGRVLTAAGTGAAFGGLEGAGGSEAGTAEGVARDTAVGAGVGGALGVGGELAAPYVARAARWAGGKLAGSAEQAGEEAVERKLKAAGATAADIRKLREKPGGLARYAEGAERLGIGRPRLGVIPQTVRTHAADAEAAAASASARKDALAGQIEGADVMVDGHAVADRLRELRSTYGKGPAGKDMRATIDDIIADYESQGLMTFADMNVERHVWSKNTNFDSNSVKQALRKKIYGILNETMAEAAERSAMMPSDMAAASEALAPSPALRGRAEAPDAEGFAVTVPPEAPTVPRMGTIPPPRGRRAGAVPLDENVPATTAIAPPAATAEPAAALAPGVGKAWRAANEDEHVARKLLGMGENKLATGGAPGLSMRDLIAAGAGHVVGGEGAAAATVAANKLLQSRGNAAAAQLLRGKQRLMGMGSGAAEGVAGALERAPASARAAGAAASASAIDDEKYGALLRQKQGQEREAAYSMLLANDAEFRARQRAKAAQAEGDTAR